MEPHSGWAEGEGPSGRPGLRNHGPANFFKALFLYFTGEPTWEIVYRLVMGNSKVIE